MITRFASQIGFNLQDSYRHLCGKASTFEGGFNFLTVFTQIVKALAYCGARQEFLVDVRDFPFDEVQRYQGGEKLQPIILEYRVYSGGIPALCNESVPEFAEGGIRGSTPGNLRCEADDRHEEQQVNPI